MNYVVSLEDFVWYTLDNGATNTTITGNTTFNTTEGENTLYLYANNSNGETVKNVTFTVNITKFSVIHNEFSGLLKGLSTAFNQTSHEDLQNLSDIILERINAGKINFNVAINVTDDLNVTDNKVDLDTHVNISLNRIELNSTALPNFNKSATLYLYNLTFSTPRILRDGAVCPTAICTQNSYSGNTLSFNVTGFTVYSAEETPADDEAQQPSGGGGGGSGGGVECLKDSACNFDEVCFNYQCVKLFDVKIIDFESPVKLGEFFDFTYFIKGMAEINGDVEVIFGIEKNGKIISSGLDTIYLGSFEEKTQTAKIFLPNNLESGAYTFFVQVNLGSYSANSERTIEVRIDEEGIATITSESETAEKDFQFYLIVALIIFAILITGLLFYIERNKIKAGLIREERWIKKHKISVLAFSLFVVLGILAYSLNLFNIILLWIKTPSFAYSLKIALAVFVLLIAIFVARKMNLFERFKIWRIKRREIRLLKEKAKRERLKFLRSKAKPKRIKLIKAKPKALTIRHPRYGRRFKKILFNLFGISVGLIKKLFKIPSKLGEKVFENLKIFSKIIKKKSKLIFDESRNLEKTLFNFAKFNLSLIFKSKKRKVTVRKLRKHEPVKKPKQKIRILHVIKKGLNSIYLLFNGFYRKSRLRIRAWDEYLLKLLKKTSRKYHVPKLSIDKKISRFWDVGKKPKHLIPKETQKEIRETFSLKSTPLKKLGKFELKLAEAIKGFMNDFLRSINNSIKSLGIFASKKIEDIARERRKVVRKTERTIEEIYEETFHLLRGIFGKKSYTNMIQDFQKALVEGRKFTKKHLKILESLEENKRREFKLTKLRIYRNIDNLEENARREFRLTKLRIHRNIDNLRNESEDLVKKLVNYSQKLDKKERERIRKTISLSKRRSTSTINKIKSNLRTASIAIHDYLIKIQVSYLRGLYNVKMVFFKDKRKIIDLIKELENREFMRMKEEEDEKVRNILEQRKEANRRKFFEKKVFGDKIEKPKVEIIPKEEPNKEQPMENTEDKSAEDIIEDIAKKEKEKGKKL